MHNQEDVAAALKPYPGLIMAYVSDIRMKAGEDDYDQVTVADCATYKELFTIDANEGAGDYRGFPACVFAAPSLELPDWYSFASDREVDEGYRDTFEELRDEYADDEDNAFTFLIEKKYPEQPEGVWQYGFVAWMPPESDYDLESEVFQRTEDWREAHSDVIGREWDVDVTVTYRHTVRVVAMNEDVAEERAVEKVDGWSELDLIDGEPEIEMESLEEV